MQKSRLDKKGLPGEGLTALISASTVLGCMNIVVPVDGSPASLRALDYAINGGQLTGDSFASLGRGPRGSDGEIGSVGAVFKTVVRTGQVAETIAQVAREDDIQQIVMGTRGLGSIQGLLMGSVATKVIHLADVPITLIK